MAQWIHKPNGSVFTRRKFRSLHVDEIHNPEEIKKREVFGALIERRWGTSRTPPTSTKSDNDEQWEEHEDDEELARIVPDIED